jgi:hypothetical protein
MCLQQGHVQSFEDSFERNEIGWLVVNEQNLCLRWSCTTRKVHVIPVLFAKILAAQEQESSAAPVSTPARGRRLVKPAATPVSPLTPQQRLFLLEAS